MPVKPIAPSQVTKKKASNIPEFVIETFNELITANWTGNQARVHQDEAVEAILLKMKIASVSGLSDEDDEKKEKMFRDTIFKDHYLDVEPVFEAAGWKVYFDKPGYNESYSAYFIFSKK